MTRTVADSALMMREIARPDARDGMSLPPQEFAWLDLAIEVKGLRIGLWLGAGVGIAVEPETRAAIERAAQILADAGAHIEEVRPFLTRPMLEGLDRFWRQRAWSDIGALPPERRARVLPYIRRWAEGGQNLTGAQVYDGMNQMIVMRDAALRACAPFDFVISPTAPVASYPAEFASPIDDPERPFEHIGFTVAFNMSGQPASSVNAGYTASGLPIGLQIIGQRFDDLGVLRLSRAWEDLRGQQRPWPRCG
jgi:Asp-tRNA(Asn)/Glu-tRNA(Gln) amidotransferase A subunit family amidase